MKGACALPDIGQRVDQLSYDDLAWAENAQLVDANDRVAMTSVLIGHGIEWIGSVPLWMYALAGSGSGYGDGYGGDAYGDHPGD